jgi:glycerol-3-phosphate acyltransferase-like protein
MVLDTLKGFVPRYPSVASISAAISLPVAAVVLDEPWPVIAFAAFAALAVVVLHRPNINRLRAGTETRLPLPPAGYEVSHSRSSVCRSAGSASSSSARSSPTVP